MTRGATRYMANNVTNFSGDNYSGVKLRNEQIGQMLTQMFLKSGSSQQEVGNIEKSENKEELHMEGKNFIWKVLYKLVLMLLIMKVG